MTREGLEIEVSGYVFHISFAITQLNRGGLTIEGLVPSLVLQNYGHF